MHMVIQVKIQEQVSYKKKILEFVQFDWLKNKLDRSKHISTEFYFSPNST